ncbi:peptide-N(4)-(N-acetyl-beta-glucosaminyl)asparagine amidase [Sitophilus oryzae]|uniref:Peptide-N(4)-(N-acetyl-beta-glucosaminyl)asparagine amidase n=1 Tax=Sitophilus oryzae TaxID=7048 RepID=A0A6J2YSN9_SITOR|nr:peptide-N(4)-(N-acetyl-beta-glucosaminyl)asparagine amidase [Sitophilus oryzae]
MSFEEVLDKLGENSIETSKETVRILLKIADNILKQPENVKIRTLQKSNHIISKKVLQVNGGSLCLRLMGFVENGTCFTLPNVDNLSSVQSTKDVLLIWLESVHSSPQNEDVEDKLNRNKEISCLTNVSSKKIDSQNSVKIKPVALPPLVPLYKNHFLHSIESHFHNALQYENKDLQNRAKSLIPLHTLEEGALRRFRMLQKRIKKDKLNNIDISIQDMLILELLEWFKEDFFTWVNSPECEHCGSETKFSHMSTDKNLLVYTNRVELHRCVSCRQFTPFPRYNDLNILLETRRGRCGEWANTFTLLCRALNWDARFIMDETDHVWTEVYSFARRKWLHCDSCENICDKPLIYESGWKKKISYVIAYSGEEVQDVTWRYTSHHKDILKNRNKCTEQELIEALFKLREIRQKDFSEARKKFLNKRLLDELVEFMTERKPDDEENQGRQSGDLDWRLLRGETTDSDGEHQHVWSINPDDPNDKTVTIQYSSSSDVYQMLVNGKKSTEMKHWSSGTFNHSNILMKKELDWKQVYLARQEGGSEGTITWKFQIQSEERRLTTIEVNFLFSTFENGNVNVKLDSGDLSLEITKEANAFKTSAFAGSSNISLTASLSGGKGDTSWQHAQLFRQPLNDDNYSFVITFSFE